MKVSEFIASHENELLARWEKLAREQIPAAREARSLVLRDHLPHVIEDVQEALRRLEVIEEARKAAAKAFTTRYSEQHGRHRASTYGYTVDHVMHEYMILRYVFTDALVQAGLWEKRAHEAITHVLELGSLSAVREFVKSLEEVQHKLLGTLAHDIRTPLGVAQVALLLLKENSKELEDPEDIKEMALQGVQRAQDMLTGLLDAIVVEAGEGIMLCFEEGDFSREIRSACEEAKRSYGSRIVSGCPMDPVIGIFDPAALRRIFENLVSNAVRHGSQTGEVRIGFEEAEDHVLLRVNNQGKPIPPAARATLFDFPSSASASSPSEGYRSWGIGLTFVKLAVEGHRGEVLLESDAESGTTFLVKLPKVPRQPGKCRTRLIR